MTGKVSISLTAMAAFGLLTLNGPAQGAYLADTFETSEVSFDVNFENGAGRQAASSSGTFTYSDGQNRTKVGASDDGGTNLGDWGPSGVSEPTGMLGLGTDVDNVTVSPDPAISTTGGFVSVSVLGGSDALLACDDRWAARLIQHLQQRGYRVPEDVAVVGYDNLEIGEICSPPVTTVDERSDVIGKTIADAAFDLIDAGKQRQQKVAPELVVRQST